MYSIILYLLVLTVTKSYMNKTDVDIHLISETPPK